MRVLLLMSQLPFPLDTGAKIRTFNLIKQLSERHEITLVTFGDERTEVFKVKELQKHCKSVRLISKKKTSYAKLAFKLFFKIPLNVQKYYSKQMDGLIRELISIDNFDLIHCDSVQVSRNVCNINTVNKIIIEHNIRM